MPKETSQINLTVGLGYFIWQPHPQKVNCVFEVDVRKPKHGFDVGPVDLILLGGACFGLQVLWTD